MKIVFSVENLILAGLRIRVQYSFQLYIQASYSDHFSCEQLIIYKLLHLGTSLPINNSSSSSSHSSFRLDSSKDSTLANSSKEMLHREQSKWIPRTVVAEL
jgi:hypothetical protein